MVKPLVVITGKSGQLGWELQQLVKEYSGHFNFLFTAREELDLGNPSSIPQFFEKIKPAYFINCAAYTAVDKAETEKESAYAINAEAVGVIARCCADANAVLVQVSTDYVFNGNEPSPRKPTDAADPVNYYGYTKWMGEKLALENNPQTLVIRTSWVYSEHGHNFVKTMLRLMREREEIKVVNDQVGSPTYAASLAEAILTVLMAFENGNRQYGVFHFSNAGVISWYDFALAIRDMAQLSCCVLPQPSSAYPTPAKRPFYSVMDTTAMQEIFSVKPVAWQTALQECINKIKAAD